MSAHPDLDVLYVPIGQGSGICGCIAARDALGLKTEIVGVQAVGAPAYALSLAAGRVIATETCDTLADGMATRAPDEEAFEIIRRGVARIVLVGDDEIAAAIRAYWSDTHNLAEGAGAAGLAARARTRAARGQKGGLVLRAATSTSPVLGGAPLPLRVVRPRALRRADIAKATDRPGHEQVHPRLPALALFRAGQRSPARVPYAARCWFRQRARSPGRGSSAGRFRARSFNIESLTVAEVAHETHRSRITIVTSGAPHVIEQVRHLLERLVPVHSVTDLTLNVRAIERELAMVTVRGKGEHRVEALRLAEAFRAKVIDATTESFVFELTGAPR